MGKTKIKTIDDSTEQTEEKLVKKAPKKERDILVEKLKQELGIESTDAKAMVDTEEPVKTVKKIIQADKKTEPSKKRSKKYLEASSNLDRNKTYPLSEALDIVKKMSYSKFNGTLEAHIKTAQTGVRGLISLPYASGKKLRILIFAPSQPQLEGVVFGTDSTIDEISQGKIDFDLIITTPEWMPKLTKLAKILGPKGLMPNPKNNTITEDVKKAAESFQTGKTEYKTEPKAPIIHLPLGKLSQPSEELIANCKALLIAIGKTKIKKVVLSPTMGPGLKLDLTSI